MRRFANLYIVLFLIDAGLSLTDELLSVFASPMPALSALRNVVAVLVIVLSMVIYSLLGIDRRLPKRVFLPLTLYVFWCSLAMWPLQGMISDVSFGAMGAFGQVFVGGVAVIALRSLYGRPQLPEELFRQPIFGWRNTLVFSAVNLLLLPLLLIYSLAAVTGYYLYEETAGFMRLSPVGIYMADRSYHRGAKDVRLAAMMHIARKGYYEELVDSLPTEKTIVLAEGVSDSDHLLKHRFNYGNLAGLVGLTSQETMELDGNRVDLDDLEAPANVEGDAAKPDILWADVDVNQFSPKTVEFLNVLGRTLLSSKPLAQGLVEYKEWAQANETPEQLAGVMDDIIAKRNTVVIDSLRRSLERYDTVVVPWGAMHMPAIEAAVLERGFVPGAKKERLVFAFSAIPFAELWQNMSARAEQEGEPRKPDGTGSDGVPGADHGNAVTI